MKRECYCQKSNKPSLTQSDLTPEKYATKKCTVSFNDTAKPSCKPCEERREIKCNEHQRKAAATSSSYTKPQENNYCACNRAKLNAKFDICTICDETKSFVDELKGIKEQILNCERTTASKTKEICSTSCELQEKRLNALEKQIKDFQELLMQRNDNLNAIAAKASNNGAKASNITIKKTTQIKTKVQKEKRPSEGSITKTEETVTQKDCGASKAKDVTPQDATNVAPGTTKSSKDVAVLSKAAVCEGFVQCQSSKTDCNTNCPSKRESELDVKESSICPNAIKDKLILEVIERTKHILTQIVDGKSPRADECKATCASTEASRPSSTKETATCIDQSVSCNTSKLKISSDPNVSQRSKTVCQAKCFNLNKTKRPKENTCAAKRTETVCVQSDVDDGKPIVELQMHLNLDSDTPSDDFRCGKSVEEPNAKSSGYVQVGIDLKMAASQELKIKCSNPDCKAKKKNKTTEPHRPCTPPPKQKDACSSCSRTLDIVKYTQDFIKELKNDKHVDNSACSSRGSSFKRTSSASTCKNVVFNTKTVDDCNQTANLASKNKAAQECKNAACPSKTPPSSSSCCSTPKINSECQLIGQNVANLSECQQILLRCSKECQQLKNILSQDKDISSDIKEFVKCKNPNCSSSSTSSSKEIRRCKNPSCPKLKRKNVRQPSCSKASDTNQDNLPKNISIYTEEKSVTTCDGFETTNRLIVFEKDTQFNSTCPSSTDNRATSEATNPCHKTIQETAVCTCPSASENDRQQKTKKCPAEETADGTENVISNRIVYLQQKNAKTVLSNVNVRAKYKPEGFSVETVIGLPKSPTREPDAALSDFDCSVFRPPEICPSPDNPPDSQTTLVPSGCAIKALADESDRCDAICPKKVLADNMNLRSVLECTADILKKSQDKCEKLVTMNNMLQQYLPQTKRDACDNSARDSANVCAPLQVPNVSLDCNFAQVKLQPIASSTPKTSPSNVCPLPLPCDSSKRTIVDDYHLNVSRQDSAVKGRKTSKQSSESKEKDALCVCKDEKKSVPTKKATLPAAEEPIAAKRTYVTDEQKPIIDVSQSGPIAKQNYNKSECPSTERRNIVVRKPLPEVVLTDNDLYPQLPAKNFSMDKLKPLGRRDKSYASSLNVNLTDDNNSTTSVSSSSSSSCSNRKSCHRCAMCLKDFQKSVKMIEREIKRIQKNTKKSNGNKKELPEEILTQIQKSYALEGANLRRKPPGNDAGTLEKLFSLLKRNVFGYDTDDLHETARKRKRKQRANVTPRKKPSTAFHKSDLKYHTMRVNKKRHRSLYQLALRGKSRTSTLKFNPYVIYSGLAVLKCRTIEQYINGMKSIVAGAEDLSKRCRKSRSTLSLLLFLLSRRLLYVAGRKLSFSVHYDYPQFLL